MDIPEGESTILSFGKIWIFSRVGLQNEVILETCIQREIQIYRFRNPIFAKESNRDIKGLIEIRQR